MILVGLGGNLPSSVGTPHQTCLSAVQTLGSHGADIIKVSRWYESAPVPASDQPFYVNGVISIDTKLSAESLLALLLEVEKTFGRSRTVQNAARTLDLDLLAYGNEIREETPVLPHPRLVDRAFVLRPLQDVAPGWQHPVTGESLESLISALNDPDSAVPLA